MYIKVLEPCHRQTKYVSKYSSMLFHVCCVACHSVGWTRPRGHTKKWWTDQPAVAGSCNFFIQFETRSCPPQRKQKQKKISDFSNLTLIRPLKTMTSLDHWIHTYKIHGVQLHTFQMSQLPVNQAVQSEPNGSSPNVEGQLHPRRLTAGTWEYRVAWKRKVIWTKPSFFRMLRGCNHSQIGHVRRITSFSRLKSFHVQLPGNVHDELTLHRYISWDHSSIPAKFSKIHLPRFP